MVNLLVKFNKKTVKAYNDFVKEVERIYKNKGFDYIESKTKLTEPEVLGLIKNDISTTLVGNPISYKRIIKRYSKLFNRSIDNNSDILLSLLYELMPESMKAMKREIENYVNDTDPNTNKRRSWRELEVLLNENSSGKQLNRQAIYFYRHGINYPERETIHKLKPLLSEKTVNDLLLELYDINVEDTKVLDIKINDVIEATKQWNDAEKELIVLFVLDSYNNKNSINDTIKKLTSLYES